MLRAIPSSSNASDSQKNIQDEKEERFSSTQVLTGMTVASIVAVSFVGLANFVPILAACPNNEQCYEADIALLPPESWEIGARTPTHAALRLLEIIDKGIYRPKIKRKSSF